jgi:hypothetical protein
MYKKKLYEVFKITEVERCSSGAGKRTNRDILNKYKVSALKDEKVQKIYFIEN